jgi:hypothetical protein
MRTVARLRIQNNRAVGSRFARTIQERATLLIQCRMKSGPSFDMGETATAPSTERVILKSPTSL